MKIYLKNNTNIYELTPQRVCDSEYGFCGYFSENFDFSDARIEIINN